MLELNPKVIKDIIRLKSQHLTTGDIIRAHPGLSKKQIKEVLSKYEQAKALSHSDNIQSSPSHS